jgi:hypothetical protein
MASDQTPIQRAAATVEDIEALPEGSVVVDRHDDVWQRRGGLWCSHETAAVDDRRLAKWAPLTVLRRGGAR